MQVGDKFILFDNARDFEAWLRQQPQIKRKVVAVQNHHTWKPNYTHFYGDNHFQLQQGMWNYHVNKRKWSDIGQHFTTFPDGKIITGRPLERKPAGIKGMNTGAVMIENLGNFDEGKDNMATEQARTIVELNAALCHYFKIDPSTVTILYHNWFASWKTCPGTNFFGGNTRQCCKKHFLPSIKKSLK